MLVVAVCKEACKVYASARQRAGTSHNTFTRLYFDTITTTATATDTLSLRAEDAVEKQSAHCRTVQLDGEAVCFVATWSHDGLLG